MDNPQLEDPIPKLYATTGIFHVGIFPCFIFPIWVFPKKSGTPKSWILIGFSIPKPSILGYPYSWKHPYIFLLSETNPAIHPLVLRHNSCARGDQCRWAHEVPHTMEIYVKAAGCHGAWAGKEHWKKTPGFRNNLDSALCFCFFVHEKTSWFEIYTGFSIWNFTTYLGDELAM